MEEGEETGEEGTRRTETGEGVGGELKYIIGDIMGGTALRGHLPPHIRSRRIRPQKVRPRKV